MEIFALIVSICALAVSILSPAFEYFWNKRMNNQNLTSEYFREIYGKIIYEDIPVYREYIHFNQNNISGTEKLLDVLREIRRKSVYFKIVNSNFYQKLINDIQCLEDYLIKCPNQMTNEEFVEFHNQIDMYIEEIYKDISNGYLGKRIKNSRKNV